MRQFRIGFAALSVASAALITDVAPAAAGKSTDWKQASLGVSHTCAVTTGGEAWCWGSGALGQLGDGGTDDSDLPVQVGDDTDWVHVAVGGDTTCALKAAGTLFCWGANHAGQVGNGDVDNDPHPSPGQVGAASDWTQLAGGKDHFCGRKIDGRLFCWGENDFGEIGNGKSGSPEPHVKQVRGAHTNWKQVATGADFTCGVRTNGKLFCWGYNQYASLGIGSADGDTHTVPERVGAARSWRKIGAGGYQACATKTNGKLFCWGRNGDGQVGIGVSSFSVNEPTRVAGGLKSWREVAGQQIDTCATDADTNLYCWGRNNHGQLGVGTTDGSPHSTPELVGSTGWTKVYNASFGEHECARQQDGRLFCWGANGLGQVGNGTSGNDQPSPVQVDHDE